MCFTGGFALAMMVDASVAAPVRRPAVGAVRARPAARRRPQPLPRRPRVRQGSAPPPAARCSACATAQDPAVGTRFDTLTRELGDNFIRVEFAGRKHATLTEHRQQEGVDRVLAFFTRSCDGCRSAWARRERVLASGVVLFLRRQIVIAALTANAIRPLPGFRAGVPAFFAGWLTSELAPHLLAVTTADAATHLTGAAPRPGRARARRRPAPPGSAT